MKKLECYSSTTKDEVKTFLNENFGSKVSIHYEGNMYPTWGDDHDWEVLLDVKGLVDAFELVDTHYIHGVKIVE